MVLELEYDRSVMGQEYKAGPFEVTSEAIHSFCKAMGETNPIYLDEEAARREGYRSVVAPPTMCVMFIRDLGMPDIKLQFGRTRFHAGQMVNTLAPIQAGDSLSASSHLKDVYPKTGRSGTMVFIVWETIFTNQDGREVAAVQESYAARE